MTPAKDGTVRYGIIGCGMMGQEHIRNLSLIPGAEVAAIHEPDPAMRARAAELAPAATFLPLDDLLARQDLGALVIAAPNRQHVPLLERIAAARAQAPLPVLVEKPLMTDPADRPRIEALTAYGAPIWVAMEYRYMPPIAELIRSAEGVTGGIRMLTIREHRYPFLEKVGHWNRFNAGSGGTFVEKCCHFFDLMRLILRDEPVRVMASAGQEVNHRDERYDGAVPDILDSGYVIVDFARGARAMLELCMFAEGSKYQEHISAIGPAGKIECLVPGPSRFWPAHLGPAPVAQLIESPRQPPGERMHPIPVDPHLLDAGDHNGSTFYQHERFHRTVTQGAPVEVTLADGLIAVEMGLAAQRSAATGEAVRLDVADRPAGVAVVAAAGR